MSSLRSRSAGRRTRTIERRWNTSLRKLPLSTSCARSRLVAATMRTSTLAIDGAADAAHGVVLERAQEARLEIGLELADLVEEQRCRWCALSKAPTRSAAAPVNAPLTWPNSSDSMSVRGTPARSHTTSGPRARGEARWMASAHSSLPVPVSPSMSTGSSEPATRSSSANSSRMTSERPQQLPERLAL